MSTGGVTAVTATSATLTGTVNPEGEATTYYFQYGTGTAYGSTTPSPAANAGSGTMHVNVSAAAGSLTPNITYHYRLVATNASGTSTGADHTFKTNAAPPIPRAPAVSTGGVKAVTATSATLTGTVNPEGQAATYYFQYGTSTAYGSTTPSPAANAGSGTMNVNVAAKAGSLTPNITYHYRLVATNASGTSTGADHTFKTAKPSTAVTIAASPNPIVYGQPTTVRGSVLGPRAAHASVTLQRSATATGPFVNLATTTAGPNRTYSFAGLAPSSNSYFRVFANGVSSAPVLVLVRFRVSFFVSRTHPRRGQLIRFRGRVAPRHNGARVRIQRVGSDRRWHTIARPVLHRTSTNSSVYGLRIRVHRGGRYRATLPPDRHHARGFSRTIRIRVH
ncbi:MAG: hypothetical protein E6G34_01285 [Actinobacteria bacterium]|nr:MAG: hypothetical protein E6G34_01285 [Actinomycetota bacterium]